MEGLPKCPAIFPRAVGRDLVDNVKKLSKELFSHPPPYPPRNIVHADPSGWFHARITESVDQKPRDKISVRRCGNSIAKWFHEGARHLCPTIPVEKRLVGPKAPPPD